MTPPSPADLFRATQHRCWSGRPGSASSLAVDAESSRSRIAVARPFRALQTSFRGLLMPAARVFDSQNAVTSGNAFVEVGESNPHARLRIGAC